MCPSRRSRLGTLEFKMQATRMHAKKVIRKTIRALSLESRLRLEISRRELHTVIKHARRYGLVQLTHTLYDLREVVKRVAAQ